MTDLIATLEGLTGQPTGDLTTLYDGAKAAGIVTDWETELWFGAALRGHLDAIGAVTALVERVFPDLEWSVGSRYKDISEPWGCVRFAPLQSVMEFGPTPAIALCIALLRAKDARDGR